MGLRSDNEALRQEASRHESVARAIVEELDLERARTLHLEEEMRESHECCLDYVALLTEAKEVYHGLAMLLRELQFENDVLAV